MARARMSARYCRSIDSRPRKTKDAIIHSLTTLYAATIFLSAFLLFQIQPVIARMILPWFGGSSAVWATCMLFFQAALLAGYTYSHVLHSRVTRKNQTYLHIAL